MSRIDDLIAEHCPSGVDFLRIGDIADVGTGSSDRKNAVENGQYPFYVRSKDVLRMDSFEFDEAAILIPGEGGIGEIFHWVVGKYALHQRAYRISFRSARVDVKFAYYYFTVHFRAFILSRAVSATVTSIRKPMITEFRIPVPPLEVQREIVKVLDLFTELEAELETELEARRRQYEHYRDSLLTFVEPKTRWTSLAGISRRVFSGGTPLATKPEYYGGDIAWLRTHEVNYADITGTAVTITQAGLDSSSAKWVRPNSVIVAISGAGVTRGRVAINKIAVTTNQHCCNLEIDDEHADPRFVFHWLSKNYSALRSRGHGNRSDLNVGIIGDFPIPVPSLAEQERIVAILDSFDALVNDISVGLPAEIAARRQQYEYYRDKLLTFDEAV